MRPFQGYGATELGPIVSANVPAARARATPTRLREGTVGRPARGVRVEVRDPETGEVLGPGEPGLLWVTGPHVMLGYLNQPELTEALVDGWYNTGDIVTIDEDGSSPSSAARAASPKLAERWCRSPRWNRCWRLTGGSDDGVPRAVVTAVPDEVPANGWSSFTPRWSNRPMSW